MSAAAVMMNRFRKWLYKPKASCEESPLPGVTVTPRVEVGTRFPADPGAQPRVAPRPGAPCGASGARGRSAGAAPAARSAAPAAARMTKQSGSRGAAPTGAGSGLCRHRGEAAEPAAVPGRRSRGAADCAEPGTGRCSSAPVVALTLCVCT